ncbi:MAG: winged helix-turn-helix domain-containing protein [Deltaproteobacteria bacterium]|nr:winged helix-turn-helix domain-containing protein [Deltaproteobacteria bacterium]
MGRSLNAADARSIAIAAQGLAGFRPAPAPARTTPAAIRAAIARLGVLQIDSVNVLQRSHYLPLWSRLGAYDRASLDRMSHDAPRTLFEYWGHEASLLPVAMQPLLRWRMARAGSDAWTRIREMRKRRAFVAKVLGAVRERGPLRVGELETIPRQPKKGWWEWSDAKIAIEWLFWSGQVTASARGQLTLGRRRGFERTYDLPERVLPPEVLAMPTPSESDAVRALIAKAAAAVGIGTANDLRDYFRIPLALARTAIAELEEEGVIERVEVAGWSKPAYRHRDARVVAIDPARGALLSPFDSLVWFRERTERMFGMRFRIELYTPADKRVHGYYVLPFLLGDALVARVDLKADREAKVLRVQAAHAEPKAPGATATALAAELRAMASWLELDRVEVMPKGDLAPKLARTLGSPLRRQ